MSKAHTITQFIRQHIGSAFVTNSGWIVAEQVYRMVLSLVVSILTARYLGPSNMGVITYALTYVNALMPVALLSIEFIAVHEIVKNPGKTGEVLGSGILMRLVSGVACFLMIVGIVAVLKPGNSLYLIVAGLNALSLIFYSVTLVESWLQANLRSKYATIIKSIGYTVMSLYKVYLLVANKSVAWFAFASSLDVMIIALLYVLFYKRQQIKMTVSRSMMKHLITQSYPLIFSGLMVVAYGQLERVILEYYHGAAKLGAYGIGYSLCLQWQFIPAAVITSARPLIMKAKENGQSNYLKRLKQLYAFIWWLSILAALFFSFTGDWLIRFMYGEVYAEAATALKIITWSQGFSLLGGVRSIWFIAEGKNKFLMASQGISAVFSIALYFILIPPYGIVGAAVSVVISQFFVAFISTLLYRETRESSKLMLDSILMKFE